MNEQCIKWKKDYYDITHWNQCCYIFYQFWDILRQTRVSFFIFNSHCIENIRARDLSPPEQNWSHTPMTTASACPLLFNHRPVYTSWFLDSRWRSTAGYVRLLRRACAERRWLWLYLDRCKYFILSFLLSKKNDMCETKLFQCVYQCVTTIITLWYTISKIRHWWMSRNYVLLF